jgi:hypothetical protein
VDKVKIRLLTPLSGLTESRAPGSEIDMDPNEAQR